MQRIWTGCLLAACLALGCQKPGYMKGSELQRRGQGPQECASRCQELGMAMGAMVLVSNDLPGCVCVPYAPSSAPPAAEGASGAAVGQVVIAAAVAAQQQQQQQQQRQQQQQQQQFYHH